MTKETDSTEQTKDFRRRLIKISQEFAVLELNLADTQE